MILSCKRVTRRMSLALCSALLMVLLTACSGIGTTGSSPTPTPTSTPSPTPTPAMATYTGNGYTISYPQGWKVSPSKVEVSFQDAQGLNVLGVIVSPNPGAISPSIVLGASLTGAEKEANMTKTTPANLPATTTVDGQTWTQQGVTGTASNGSQSGPFEIVGLAINHPANSANPQIFEIVYAGPDLDATMLDQQIFQAMLASFKFTS